MLTFGVMNLRGIGKGGCIGNKCGNRAFVGTYTCGFKSPRKCQKLRIRGDRGCRATCEVESRHVHRGQA